MNNRLGLSIFVWYLWFASSHIDDISDTYKCQEGGIHGHAPAPLKDLWQTVNASKQRNMDTVTDFDPFHVDRPGRQSLFAGLASSSVAG